MFPDEYMTQPCTITHVAHDGPADEYGPTIEPVTVERAWDAAFGGAVA